LKLYFDLNTAPPVKHRSAPGGSFLVSQNTCHDHHSRKHFGIW